MRGFKVQRFKGSEVKGSLGVEQLASPGPPNFSYFGGSGIAEKANPPEEDKYRIMKDWQQVGGTSFLRAHFVFGVQ